MIPTPPTRQRCWTHPAREADVRCPGCERFYCRECVTEHTGRLLCAACLQPALPPALPPLLQRPGFWRAPLLVLTRVVQLTAGLLLTWYFFQQLGRQLTTLPDESHVRKLWEEASAFDDDL